ncbi:Dyp-type peroxidase [Kitasatospora sp. NPDC050543]|uniref:Dyp-type peroxidase n=1 Tax=Kitasatospora sp. NPDC050543 TaxID=3364054 RepID=UPI0037BC7DF2
MPADLKLRESDEIQGDVIAGFKKDHVTLLFLKFEDAARARSWLRQLTPRIATTRQVAAFNEAFSAARKSSGGDDPKSLKAVWTSISFTYEGLRMLSDSEPVEQAPTGSGLEAFKDGSARRAGAIGDTGDNSPENWLFGNGKGQPVHAVLTVAADTAQDLQAQVSDHREATAQSKIVIVFQQNAATLLGTRRGKEHFGFKDGVSEPGVLGFDPPDPNRPEEVEGHPGTRLVPAGEFVVGERPAPGSFTDFPAWARNGSFQVVRRLAQDVPGWWAQVAVELKALKKAKAVPQEATSEWLAARLVGRWRSGAPVCKHQMADVPFDPEASKDNDFGFRDDLDGLVTPLFSHLRKTNPRDALQERPDGPVLDAKDLDGRRIMRRGAPYGQPFDPASEGPGGPDDPRGLLFVCYQADIARQFEFIQTAWVDEPNFPRGRDPEPGGDPMIGLASEISYESRDADGSRRVTPLRFQQFVQTQGSVYAFAPSLSTLRLLGEGRLTGPAVQPGGDTQKEPRREEPTDPAKEPAREQAPGQGLPVDEFLPVPDQQRRNGVSEYWAFRGARYRKISVADGSAHTDKLIKADGGLDGWNSLQGASRIDAVLPMPDLQRSNGKSWYWVFHTVGGRQVYRAVSVADGGAHTDVMERSDRELSMWASLNGVTRVDAFLPVPDQQRSNGKSWYWVFHSTGAKQLYRLISVADGGAHTDVMERSDRELSMWVSLNGVTRVDACLAVPDQQRVSGLSEYWIFHRDQYRKISVADGAGHQDRLVTGDRAVSGWESLL